jgi:hypothetical protein
MTDEPVPTTHTPARDVTSVDDLVTVSIMCLYDGWTTSHSAYIAEEASTLAADDWFDHAPEVPL